MHFENFDDSCPFVVPVRVLLRHFLFDGVRVTTYYPL
jgi:hypothetical protein